MPLMKMGGRLLNARPKKRSKARQECFSDTERNLLKCVTRYYSEEEEAMYPFTDEDAFRDFANWLAYQISMSQLQEDMEKTMKKYQQIATANNLNTLKCRDRKAFKLADRIWGAGCTEQRMRKNTTNLSMYPFLRDLINLAAKSRNSIIFNETILKRCIEKIESSKLEDLNNRWFLLQEDDMKNQWSQLQQKKMKNEVSIDLLIDKSNISEKKKDIISDMRKLILQVCWH